MFGRESITNHPEIAPFWEAAEKRNFVLPRCTACGKAHWYPRGICPHCFSDAIEWQPSEGKGVIYSLAINRGTPSYVVAYVKLAEGPLMMVNVVDDDPDSLKIGQTVRIAFAESYEDAPMPHVVRD